MINKIAGAMAVVGALMMVLMLVYVDLFQWWERGLIALGALVFVSPCVSLKAGQLIHEMNGSYFDER